MKILYAAGNTVSSKLQLYRWLENQDFTDHTIKIAAYKKSSPININIDWTLDCLLNLFNSNLISFDQNENVAIYMDAIRNFKPDLIISDLEIFTSSIALELNIPVWQYSSQLLQFGLSKKETYSLGLSSTYSYLFNRDAAMSQRVNNILINSERNYIYSHLGDLELPIEIKDNFEWIRPYYNQGKKSVVCQHDIVGMSHDQNKNILSFVRGKDDCVIFSEYDHYHNNMSHKNIYNTTEYYCNLFNSNTVICESQANLLADAFYNFKKPIIDINHSDVNSLINGLVSVKYNLAHDIINEYDPSENYIDSLKYNAKIHHLHEKLNALIY